MVAERKGPASAGPGLRKCGPERARAREDSVLELPDHAFEAWALSRIYGAYGTPTEAEELRAIDADRRLRAWAQNGGRAGEQAALPGVEVESPIERMMLDAFLSSGFFDPLPVASEVVIASGPFGLLLQQVVVPSSETRYRLDFAVVDPASETYLALEVDGHQFHEATAEQAQRDKARDRRLTAAGWRVLRFTGSEVHRDATGCVAEVLAILSRRGARKAG